MEFETKILHLAGKLLKIASREFSNHGCNQLPNDFLSELSDSEKENLSLMCHQWNENRMDPTEYEPGDHSTIYYDWILMRFIGDRLKDKQ